MSRKTTKSASNTSGAAKRPTITRRFTSPPPAAVAAPAAAAVVEAPAVAAAPVAPVAPAIDAARLAELTADVRRLDADLASAAAVALGDVRAPAAVDALIEVALNESNYFHGVVRAAAAESLARQGDARAVPALIAAVRDPMAEASAEAVRALATLGDAGRRAGGHGAGRGGAQCGRVLPAGRAAGGGEGAGDVRRRGGAAGSGGGRGRRGRGRGDPAGGGLSG